MLAIVVIGTIVFLISLFTTKQLIKILRQKGVMDIPNQRSSHQVPTPRGGGIAIVIALFAGLALAWMTGSTFLDGYFCAGLGLLALTGWLDDKIDLSPITRFLIHTLAACLILFAHGAIEWVPLPPPLDWELGVFAYPITFIWFLGVMNIYNFLDGIDGYAGAQAVVVGLGLAVFYPVMEVWLVAVIIVGAALGFLKYNWRPAKIFMGDVGSIPLGFVFASLPFYLNPGDPARAVYVMALLLWFFLADGAYTLIRRILKREKIWEAHRTHLYQRLNISGWSHAKIVITILSLQLILAAITYSWPSLAIIAASILFATLIAVTLRAEKACL